ncbi:DNA polymerase Y family protein [Nocardioides oleivorans]|uniref:DNA polymerase Y family protein n=1 Tax=Nocardioides oleivorans TaxID=273676 RepID=A0A4V1RLF6_9ACTN|nr:DNA polymerase Y family protein [Nocardioides oleivorans]RYB95612.1 DNA polymerase Y family protein [Nocardioides oleivorans]
MRVMVVWCPDWSVVAALDEAERSPRSPAAVLSANIVEVCNGPARAEGVRRGQRRRDAQSRCPDLVLLPANPDRDARAFEPVLSVVEELRPGVAALRPGLLAVRAPGSWYGTESDAAATTCQALVESGVWDVRIGIADDLFTAEQAARTAGVQAWEVVPAGGSAAFLRGLPVQVLQGDGAPGRDLVSLLQRLGLRTLGDLADLPGDAVEHRLGTYGAGVRRRARGEDPTLFAARTPPPELEADVVFEPPLDSVEAITFSVRTTAEAFLDRLAHHQLVATGVRVQAESDGVLCSSRTWLHPRHFSARDLVDRVHWQLQSAGSTSGPSGMRARKSVGRVQAPIDRVRFLPEVVEPAAAHGEALWGAASDDLVERGVARVQGMVGFDAVRRPVLQGGRSPAARQELVPWGERAVDLRPVDRPWPGRVPGPAPVRVFASPPVAEVVDDAGRDVRLTDRGIVTGEPRRFRVGAGVLPWQPVTAWAGPWPTDEGWWAGGTGITARFQVVGADGRAWLLVRAPEGWTLEAAYD